MHKDHVQRVYPKSARLLHAPTAKTEAPTSHSQASPKVICVEEAVKLGINIDDIDIAPLPVPNNSPLDLARDGVLLSIDTQRAIDTQPEHILVLQPPLLPVPTSLLACLLDNAQLVLETPELALQPLALNLEVGARLRDSEFIRVEGEDLGGVGAGVVGLGLRV